MEIILLKDNQVFARTNDSDSMASSDDYSLMCVNELPEYPTDGKTYELKLVDGVLTWVVKVDVSSLEQQVEDLQNAVVDLYEMITEAQNG